MFPQRVHLQQPSQACRTFWDSGTRSMVRLCWSWGSIRSPSLLCILWAWDSTSRTSGPGGFTGKDQADGREKRQRAGLLGFSTLQEAAGVQVSFHSSAGSQEWHMGNGTCQWGGTSCVGRIKKPACTLLGRDWTYLRLVLALVSQHSDCWTAPLPGLVPLPCTEALSQYFACHLCCTCTSLHWSCLWPPCS